MSKGYKVCSTCECKNCDHEKSSCNPCKNCAGMVSEVKSSCNNKVSVVKTTGYTIEDLKSACRAFGVLGTKKIASLLESVGCRGVKDVEKLIAKASLSLERAVILFDKHYFKCPNCDQELNVTTDDLYVYEEIPPKYCSKCGQKLKWNT